MIADEALALGAIFFGGRMLASKRVIVFASQKGGSGKTTLSGHIAVEAGRQGAGPVALIDTDPQGSLAKWWNVRQDPQPAFIQSVFSNLFHDENSCELCCHGENATNWRTTIG